MPFRCHEEEGVFVIHASGVIRMDDVQTLALEEERYFARSDCRGLFLCDCLELKVISPDGADAMVDRMRVDNPKVTRAAFIVAEGTAALQLKRLIRDAAGGNRATFATAAQARAWLEG
jgi:hypothetical protein